MKKLILLLVLLSSCFAQGAKHPIEDEMRNLAANILNGNDNQQTSARVEDLWNQCKTVDAANNNSAATDLFRVIFRNVHSTLTQENTVNVVNTNTVAPGITISNNVFNQKSNESRYDFLTDFLVSIGVDLTIATVKTIYDYYYPTKDSIIENNNAPLIKKDDAFWEHAKDHKEEADAYIGEIVNADKRFDDEKKAEIEKYCNVFSTDVPWDKIFSKTWKDCNCDTTLFEHMLEIMAKKVNLRLRGIRKYEEQGPTCWNKMADLLEAKKSQYSPYYVGYIEKKDLDFWLHAKNDQKNYKLEADCYMHNVIINTDSRFNEERIEEIKKYCMIFPSKIPHEKIIDKTLSDSAKTGKCDTSLFQGMLQIMATTKDLKHAGLTSKSDDPCLQEMIDLLNKKKAEQQSKKP